MQALPLITALAHIESPITVSHPLHPPVHALARNVSAQTRPGPKTEAVSAVKEIRGQLEASLGVSRFGGLGPPQRSVSAASSTSSSSSSGPSKRVNAPSRPTLPVKAHPVAAHKPTVKASTRPPTSRPPQRPPVAGVRPQPTQPKTHQGATSLSGRGAAPISIPKSTVREPASHPKTEPPKRPALAPRAQLLSGLNAPNAPQPVKSQTAQPNRNGSRPGENQKPAQPAKVASASNPLKRPISAVHLAPPSRSAILSNGRAVATGQSGLGRPHLGLPARLIRDPKKPHAPPVFSLGVGNDATSLGIASMARPMYRSPARPCPSAYVNHDGRGTPSAVRVLNVRRFAVPSSSLTTAAWDSFSYWYAKKSHTSQSNAAAKRHTDQGRGEPQWKHTRRKSYFGWTS